MGFEIGNPKAVKITMADQNTIFFPFLHKDQPLTCFYTSNDDESKKIGYSQEGLDNFILIEWDQENNIKKLIPEDKIHNLNYDDFFPFCSNSDGSIVVGDLSSQIKGVKFAYKMTSQGLERLPTLKGGTESSSNHIGPQSEIVGYAIDGETGQKKAVVWTADGIQPLPMLNGGNEASALFSTPKSIVGYATDGSDNNQKKIVQWFQGKVLPLEELDSKNNILEAVSRDGSLIFGHTETQALVWVDGKVQTLASYLKKTKLDPKSIPAEVLCVSPDGSHFVMQTQDKNHYVVHRPRLDLF